MRILLLEGLKQQFDWPNQFPFHVRILIYNSSIIGSIHTLVRSKKLTLSRVLVASKHVSMRPFGEFFMTHITPFFKLRDRPRRRNVTGPRRTHSRSIVVDALPNRRARNKCPKPWPRCSEFLRRSNKRVITRTKRHDINNTRICRIMPNLFTLSFEKNVTGERITTPRSVLQEANGHQQKSSE